MVLKPCSETNRDSSKLEEPSMEGCSTELEREVTMTMTDPISSSKRKRKAELDPEPEEEEEEESEEGSEEIAMSEDDEKEIDLLEVPEWDVDSFDGVVYSSSPEPEYPPHLQPYDRVERSEEHYRLYKQQLINSKGFMVDPSLRPYDLYEGIRPVNFELEKTFKERCQKTISVCLERYNQDNGLNVEFVEVVRANYRGGPRPKSYITFMAREKPDGPLVEYQAKGMTTLDKKRHPILCRPTPTTKPQNQN